MDRLHLVTQPNESRPTNVVREPCDFHTRLLGFETTFEADWYVSLRQPEAPGYELAPLDPAHPTVPEGYGVPARGLLLNFEVEDVDAEWDRLVAGEGLRPNGPAVPLPPAMTPPRAASPHGTAPCGDAARRGDAGTGVFTPPCTAAAPRPRDRPGREAAR
ncbi:glyoxalase [Planomonospora sphaerica]|uniref:Glyoxalase n=1 Tax=Planomonospora sphaerica TaxID=161355 RepID=A0A161LM33_9ACTN|nr:hypothetical protein [Planomonospora sphaerica]GAT65536.1 glyoxalase [Planomonospora sphaerica]